MIDVTIQQGVLLNILDPEGWTPEPVRCFRHEGEACPRCDGSGHRPRKHCAECGEPAGRPREGGKALMGLRNRRERDQPFYCLGCHPELGGGLPTLNGMEY